MFNHCLSKGTKKQNRKWTKKEIKNPALTCSIAHFPGVNMLTMLQGINAIWLKELVLVSATSRLQNINTGSICPIPWGFLLFVCLLLVCSPFYFQCIKGVQESRKQQSILLTALNECRPSRKYLIFSQTRHSCGQHPGSLSVVTFGHAILFACRTTPSLASWWK